MTLALAEARLAGAAGDVPIGAVALDPDGELLARAHNEREARQDPTAHAEVLLLQRAAEAVGSWRLLGVTVVVTLEPCFMCAGALVLARVARVVWGAPDPKAGAAGSLANVLSDGRLNHQPAVASGVLGSECGELLRTFFRGRRLGRPN